MSHKYGIYQTSNKSCIFYKQDEDGKQSTFNIFVSPKKDTKKLHAFIDNDQLEQENWEATEEESLEEVVRAFGGWASDAPIVFDLEARKSMSQCIKSVMKKEEID